MNRQHMNYEDELYVPYLSQRKRKINNIIAFCESYPAALDDQSFRECVFSRLLSHLEEQLHYKEHLYKTISCEHLDKYKISNQQKVTDLLEACSKLQGRSEDIATHFYKLVSQWQEQHHDAMQNECENCDLLAGCTKHLR
ncbi:hypothetical protein MTBPR1_40069 [Candidatus Terasakiella magnetica]|uniref:Hemerythrin-like domain-containing protein n=1 Tax=Candidatus Terasakiella magnetica TaxID=1867952 RepID=A0A1C3RIF5_9PROT|nr:hypothetical protein [Candidatus Terasakiella magnetica]SCA57046.1 hypothetical protein MTBPR1_40069 [Candidatus Terasakiella magnetica]